MSKASTLFWFFNLVCFSLIILFSLIAQPVFSENYLRIVDAMTLPDALSLYLRTHYKIGHPLCYAILTAITSICLRRRYLIAILLPFSLGAILEFVQSFLPTRSASWIDLGYNLAGVLTGAALVWVVKNMRGQSIDEVDHKSLISRD